MKTSVLIASFLTSSACLAGATVSDVIVRQQWPWNTSVTVDYLVSGTDGADTQVIVSAYRGNTLLGYLPQSALTGDVIINSDGEKRIAFNPADVSFLASLPTMNDFRVDVSVDASANPIYMILDLTKSKTDLGFKTYVTEEALTNGVWGSWQRSPCGMLPNSVIWTGVTQDPRYSTSCLVLRRIPAGSFTYGTDSSASYYNGTEIQVSTVTISKDYWIGVFEFTKAQCSYAFGEVPATGNSQLSFPMTGLFYGSYEAKDSIRGMVGTTDYNWPNDDHVRSGTVMGKLRDMTGLAVDLPTEAQWNKAARAGSSGPYYHTTSTTVGDSALNQVAWYVNNSADKFHAVGQKLPNDYGLYDVLGNAAEWVLDWYVKNYTPDVTDPKGPTSDPEDTKLRVNVGGNYYVYPNKNGGKDAAHLGYRTGVAYNTQPARTGFRVCCPAE